MRKSYTILSGTKGIFAQALPFLLVSVVGLLVFFTAIGIVSADDLKEDSEGMYAVSTVIVALMPSIFFISLHNYSDKAFSVGGGTPFIRSLPNAVEIYIRGRRFLEILIYVAILIAGGLMTVLQLVFNPEADLLSMLGNTVVGMIFFSIVVFACGITNRVLYYIALAIGFALSVAASIYNVVVSFTTPLALGIGLAVFALLAAAGNVFYTKSVRKEWYNA